LGSHLVGEGSSGEKKFFSSVTVSWNKGRQIVIKMGGGKSGKKRRVEGREKDALPHLYPKS